MGDKKKKRGGCSLTGMLFSVLTLWWIFGSGIKVWVTGSEDSSLKETVQALTTNKNVMKVVEGVSGLVTEIDSNVSVKNVEEVEEPIRTADDILQDDESNTNNVGE